MKSKYRYYLPSIIFVILILVSIVAINLITEIKAKRNRTYYENSIIKNLSTDVQLKIKNYIDKIESMKEFVKERKDIGIDYDEFYLFSSGLFENDESIENISIAPNAIQKFIFPIEHNNLIEYDLLKDKRKRVIKAVTRAISNNEIVINGPYPMRQDKTKNIVVIRYPIYFDNGNFYGLINVVLKTSGLFQLNTSIKYNDISFQIKDKNSTILFGNKFYDPIDTIKPIFLDHFGWQMTFGRTKSYSNLIIKEDKIKNIVFLSFFIFSLLGGIIFIFKNGKIKLEKEQRTIELISANKELQMKNNIIEESEILLRSCLKSFNNIIILAIDKNYSYLYYNDFHKKVMKDLYNQDIETGKNILDYMDIIEDRNRAKKNYDLTFSGRSYSIIEEYGEKQEKIFEAYFSPILNNENKIIGATVFAQDITKKIKQNQELIYEKELAQKYLNDLMLAGNIFENSITNAPLPIIIHTEDGTVLNISKALTKLTHYTISDTPTIFQWTTKAYNKNKDKVLKFIKKLYEYPNTQHFNQFRVTTKDNRQLIWDFNSGYIGKLPDGRAVAMSIATDITERLAKEKEINYLSYHDQLTGLYNRRFFEEQLKTLDDPSSLPLSIVMGDVNGLKLINDAFGHYAGDKLLKTIGDVISKNIEKNHMAARWGGDEFIILLPNSEIDVAERLIEKIEKNIKETFFEYGSLSISFGADTKNKEKENINEVFIIAEKLMYQNKLLKVDSVRGETIDIIMNTLFEKSPNIKEHSMRVSKISGLIAEKMGFSKTIINDIKTIGMIHDIGKIVIDLNILNKPDKLTDEERAIVEQHPLSGSRMLGSSQKYSRLSSGVLHHHERIDGKGYPNKISGDQIPIESRIILVADSFDMMTSKRPYNLNPLSLEEAISELKKCSGTQFDKTVVDIFINKILLLNIL